jgi:ankyrin repeat protein
MPLSYTNLCLLHAQAVKQLVENGANINARSKESKNHTALHEAVIGGHKEVAQYLLQMGANQVGPAQCAVAFPDPVVVVRAGRIT